jgi:hypothetical protein
MKNNNYPEFGIKVIEIYKYFIVLFVNSASYPQEAGVQCQGW